MALPLEQQNEPQESQGQDQQEKVRKEDVEIITRLGIKLLANGGLDQIKDALEKSDDPAQVIGTFIAQLMAKILEQVSSQIDIDPRAFLANGGFLDAILDYIETKLKYPPEFSDQIYQQVVEVIKAAASSGQGQQQQPQQQPQQGMPAQPPQGGMPNG